MPTVIAILLVVLPLFALATLVYDTLKIADRIGGFPPGRIHQPRLRRLTDGPPGDPDHA